jgi:hypothetical protein
MNTTKKRNTLSVPKLKSGMKLFVPGTNAGKFFHFHSAVISSPIYPPLPEAFKRAADMILDAHLAAKGSHNDILLFPVLYLYRHCVELKLKDLLLLGICSGFFNKATADKILDKDKGIIGKHALCALWNKARDLLAHHYPSELQLKVAESMINDLHQIDPDGQTLRYDREKGTLKLRRPKYKHEGKVRPHPVYNVPETIDIENLRQSFDRLYEYLESRYGGILDWWHAGQQATDW